jgi:iron(III) transport system ATP-binding protein
MDMAGVELKEVSVCYGTGKVFDRLNFSLAAGDKVVITGPSGCGKTTMLRLIAGLEMPCRGEVLLGGRVVSKPGWILPPNRRNLGFVFQAPSLWPHMTVEQNIMFGLARKPYKDAKKRLNEIMGKTSVSHLAGRYPDQISGGEARRVSIARALAPAPPFLLMDEPLTSLDKSLKESILLMIRDLAEDENVSLLYVTHDLSEAPYISDNIFTLC